MPIKIYVYLTSAPQGGGGSVRQAHMVISPGRSEALRTMADNPESGNWSELNLAMEVDASEFVGRASAILAGEATESRRVGPEVVRRVRDIQDRMERRGDDDGLASAIMDERRSVVTPASKPKIGESPTVPDGTAQFVANLRMVHDRMGRLLSASENRALLSILGKVEDTLLPGKPTNKGGLDRRRGGAHGKFV